MQPKLLALVHHIVEKGVNDGWCEAHEDIENPSDEQVMDIIIQAVMYEFNQYFEFSDLAE